MIRFYIASNYEDMKVERELITTLILSQFDDSDEGPMIEVIDLHLGGPSEVDEQTRSQAMYPIAINEVQNADYLIVLAGERYGYFLDEETLKSVPDNIAKPAEYTKSLLELTVDARLAWPSLRDRCIFCFRDTIENLPDEYRDTYEPESAKHRKRMVAFKEAISKNYPNQVFKYSASWNHEEKTVDNNFGEFLISLDSYLYKLVSVDIEKQRAMTKVEREFLAINNFVTPRNRDFVGHDELVIEIMKEVHSSKNCIVVLHGPSGRGKTAIMSWLSIVKMDQPVLSFFCGLNGQSLKDICELFITYFDDKWGVKPKKRELSPLGFVTLLGDYLELIGKIEEPSKQPIILIDGLDELPEGDKAINYLLNLKKKQLSTSIILSCSRNVESFELKNSQDSVKIIGFNIDKLNAGDREMLVSRILGKKLKNRDTYLEQVITTHNRAHNSLYMSMLATVAQMWYPTSRKNSSKEQIDEFISSMPEDMFSYLLEYASNRINEESCRLMLGLIGLSRGGFRVNDLNNIFSVLEKPFDYLEFYTLYSYLKKYIIERSSGRLDFGHIELKEAAEGLISSEERPKLHGAIKDYLLSLSTQNTTRIKELYYHSVLSGDLSPIIDDMKHRGRTSPKSILTNYLGITNPPLSQKAVSDEDNNFIEQQVYELCRMDRGKWLGDLLSHGLSGLDAFDLNCVGLFLVYRLWSIVGFSRFDFEVFTDIYTKAIKTFRVLPKIQNTPANTWILSLLHVRLGELLRRRIKNDEAAEQFNMAYEIISSETLAQSADDETNLIFDKYRMKTGLGRVLMYGKQPENSRVLYQESLENVDSIFNEIPMARNLQRFLCLALLMNYCWVTDNYDEGEEYAFEALSVLNLPKPMKNLPEEEHLFVKEAFRSESQPSGKLEGFDLDYMLVKCHCADSGVIKSLSLVELGEAVRFYRDFAGLLSQAEKFGLALYTSMYALVLAEQYVRIYINPISRILLAECYEKLGNIYHQMERYEDAIKVHKAGLKQTGRLVTELDTDTDRLNYAYFEYFLALSHDSVGNESSANAYYRNCLDMCTKLSENPDEDLLMIYTGIAGSAYGIFRNSNESEEERLMLDKALNATRKCVSMTNDKSQQEWLDILESLWEEYDND